MKPSNMVLALVALAAATSMPEKVVSAEVDASPEAGSILETGAPLVDGGSHYEPGEGTVYDTRTKLTWQLDVPMDPVSWSQGRDNCAALDLGGTGWRLPSVSELQTLIDETASDPAIDLTAFPGTASDYFWTSSVLPRFESFAWTVYFGYGLSTFFDVNQNHLVRCVK